MRKILIGLLILAMPTIGMAVVTKTIPQYTEDVSPPSTNLLLESNASGNYKKVQIKNIMNNVIVSTANHALTASTAINANLATTASNLENNNISQFTNDGGYLQQTDTDLLYLRINATANVATNSIQLNGQSASYYQAASIAVTQNNGVTTYNIKVSSANIANTANIVPWAGITSKPTTITGYGITDTILTNNYYGSSTINGNLVATGVSMTNATANTLVYGLTTIANSTARGQISTLTISANMTGTIWTLLTADGVGSYVTANATSSANVPICYAILAETGTGNRQCLFDGWVRNDSWTWVRGPIYLSTTGTLTQTAPSAVGNLVQIVGYAHTATIIRFRPDYTYIEVK